MSPFLERIKAYAKEKELSLRQVSLSVGLSGAYLSNSLKQGSTPSVEIISKIIDKYPDLSPYWLLTGKGSMIINADLVGEIEQTYRTSKSIDEIIDDKIDIKLITLSPKIRKMVAKEIEEKLGEVLKELQSPKDKEDPVLKDEDDPT